MVGHTDASETCSSPQLSSRSAVTRGVRRKPPKASTVLLPSAENDDKVAPKRAREAQASALLAQFTVFPTWCLARGRPTGNNPPLTITPHLGHLRTGISSSERASRWLLLMCTAYARTSPKLSWSHLAWLLQASCSSGFQQRRGANYR
ncbi:hypothetical protein CPAR01_01466 [Colletotrichum paranaense]|uniref:Uncharacterized protein n=1 Tax=Colletotrichum paranaense TaxID=1914294 RepID=A0ABQ9T745_9PEZI|nr:uncharacterized protein CPAR01_01466 [Colletotrichum paranaense]KAK1547499.1 hypothetical protein CPAR01_01466 [Colletotrichum paranaense]